MIMVEQRRERNGRRAMDSRSKGMSNDNDEDDDDPGIAGQACP